MTLTVDIDTAPLERDIQDMLEQLGDLKNRVMVEMLDWQTQDMHRQYPNLELPDDQSVETDIWPRSRLAKKYVPTGHPRGRPTGRGLPRKVPVARGQRQPSHRPILRPELLTKFQNRMHGLLTAIRWKPL